MTKILILGATGMLGHGILQALHGSSSEVILTARAGKGAELAAKLKLMQFDAGSDSLTAFDSVLEEGDFIINCIGIIKPHISDSDAAQRKVAMQINGIFPDDLATYAESKGLRVIQIATDCVYSGSTGLYSEADVFDALDVYGKTKSLGEVPSSSMMHLRVSIIGPEVGRSTSLFEWVRNQPRDAQIFGFTDHLWNGVTTLHFGKICRGIIEQDLFQSGVYHVVPGSIVSKLDLVTAIIKICDRKDIQISPKASGKLIDRTLSTQDQNFNNRIWEAAGYSKPATVELMIEEMII